MERVGRSILDFFGVVLKVESNELSYINESGHNVFTSQYYLNRGTCCKSNCLHCPYGTTLKNFGLQFKSIDHESLTLAVEIVGDPNNTDKQSLASDLLSNAFGGGKKKTVLDSKTRDNFRFVLLKDFICGVVEISSLGVKELYLRKHFRNQGLSRDVVSSYFS